MNGFKRFIGASGRVSRTGYWLAMLGAAAFGLTFILLSQVELVPAAVVMVAMLIYAWVWLSVAACRSRDMGHSGWLALILLVPFLGVLVFFWFGLARTAPTGMRQSRFQ